MKVRRPAIFLLATLWSLGPSSSLFAQVADDLTPISAARSIAKGLDLDRSYLGITSLIVGAYCRHREFEAAFEFVNSRNLDDRDNLYGQIARFAVEANDSAVADKALKSALELLPELDEDGSSDSSLSSDLVRLAIKNNDPALAARFLAKTENGERKARALYLVAEYFIREGNREKAFASLDSVLDQIKSFDEDASEDRIELLAKMAVDFARLGKTERAAEVAKQAKEAAVSEPANQERVLPKILLMDAELGDFEQALSRVGALKDYQKFDVALSLASLYRSAGNKPAAMSLLVEAQEIGVEEQSAGEGSGSLEKLVSAYLDAERSDEAFALLLKISDAYSLKTAAITMANWYQAQKRINDAQSALNIAARKAASIVSEKSEDIPGTASFSDAQTKSRILLGLVAKYVELEDSAGAESAAKAIDQPQYRAQALSIAAGAVARGSDRERARRVFTKALEISDKAAEYRHDTQPQDALIQIAKEASANGFKEIASAALSRFLKRLDIDEADANDMFYLLDMGLLVDANGIPVSKQSRTTLKQILRRVEENK